MIIKLIFIIFLIYIIFYCLNILLKPLEHMKMMNTKLVDTLEKNGYEINVDNYTIKKCNNNTCNQKNYKSIDFNDEKSHYLSKNKHLSNTIFLKNSIPTPIHVIIDHKNKDEYLNKSIIFPCVLKPIDGMQGTDVYTFIKNKEQFNKILLQLLNKYDTVLMENQVYGKNYRIFIFNNQVMDVIEREQPYIIGDDKHTIEELINIKNENQLKANLYPIQKIDKELIKEQNCNMNTILHDNQKVYITNTINFHNGANPKRIDLSKVPIENINMFIHAHKLIGLECSGIDYMSDDIYIPYYKNNGHIIEINDMVDTQIHVDADNKKDPNYLFNNIVKSFEF
jgi:cyanophycin synthetase